MDEEDYQIMLDTICSNCCYEYSCIFLNCERYRRLNRLNKEHFNNPPLKFEELKLSTPYWDDKEKLWCYFTTLNENLKTVVEITIEHQAMMCAFAFKENRFYRREVK